MTDVVTAFFDPPNQVIITPVVQTVSYNGVTITVTPPPTNIQVLTVGVQGPPGTGSDVTASDIAYDDTQTNLGANNVQDAIAALFALLGGSPLPPTGFDFVSYLGNQVVHLGEPVIQEIP